MDDYDCPTAADPDLYTRLMQERYGPLRAVFAEQNRPTPPLPRSRPRRHSARWPDPDATKHRDDLLRALDFHRQRTST
ncbi:hypothetical protein OG196_14635 [Kitasatospora purpeofusca]|uniref:hypothetical protein n=1 Tax=Kitasatospora purpeofusca TaxID=67352 RepID=UPI002E0F9690|nr:hypothetical protein OG196_14635 [Kitasatospora purpeofusca]